MISIKQRAIAIEKLVIADEIKIKQLEEIILDCYNEMAAQDQNMRPEINHDIAEGLQIANNLLQKLKAC